MEKINKAAADLLEQYRLTAKRLGVTFEISTLYLFLTNVEDLGVSLMLTQIIVTEDRASAYIPLTGKYVHTKASDERENS